MNPSAGSARELLRHALATVAYRGGKALRGAPESFATFRIGEATRAPVKSAVAHAAPGAVGTTATVSVCHCRSWACTSESPETAPAMIGCVGP